MQAKQIYFGENPGKCRYTNLLSRMSGLSNDWQKGFLLGINVFIHKRKRSEYHLSKLDSLR